MPQFLPKQTIGRYTLIRQIGYGGYSSVWLAENRTPIATTEVAIKFVDPILDDKYDLDLTDIKEEAKIWNAAGKHPNLHSLIEADVYNNNHPALVTEFAQEGSLRRKMKDTGGPIDIETASTIVLGILSGLRHLHNRAIIHRDLKPENILLFEETPRITDFGLSKFRDKANTSKGRGTVDYKAPEVFNGNRTNQTDLWAVGIIFYEMLTNSLPFPGIDEYTLMNAIINNQPSPMLSSIPPNIQRIINRALEKDLSKRYKQAIEMVSDLQEAFGSISSAPSVDQSPIESEVTESNPLMNGIIFDQFIKMNRFASLTTLSTDQFTNYIGLSSNGNSIGFKTCYLVQPHRIWQLIEYLKSTAASEIRARSLSNYSIYITGAVEDMNAIATIFRNARQSVDSIALHLVTIVGNHATKLCHL